MRVGMAAVFRNPGRARADLDVYRDDLRLADLCEPLGFDSIWSVEHHFFVGLQVWGTPEQCYDKILDIRRRLGNDHFVGVFPYAGMPAAEAERSLRLFAKDVIPTLQNLEPEPSPA
jgi:alkanesulfonate monooxygenase SsuD/methylene tetrahydromethanopterin reductase-like flavin-dependent oxidoreductase (luciferase family)